MNKQELDKQQHLKDAQNTLRNLEGKSGDHIQFRKDCVNEFITWLETGNTNHINPNTE